MATQPQQKPGRSKQDYATPENFITAVKFRLGVREFAFDFAADETNHKADHWWGEAFDALHASPAMWKDQLHRHGESGWGWLNPPFKNIAPWSRRCAEVRALGGSIAFLVPAGVGANWYRDHVDGRALVLALNGRLAFMPDKPDWWYPKDCILALYAPHFPPGFEIWDWRRTLREAA